jgi:hypothetical protein
MLLNPERAPALISKWQKLLGRDLESIQVEYKADGVSVQLFGMPGTAFEKKGGDGEPVSITVPEYRDIKTKESAPSQEEAIFAFKNKFEVRLNQEWPADIPLGDGSETALRNAVQALPLAQRRVMLMSNKQFRTAYPNGFAGGANPPA